MYSNQDIAKKASALPLDPNLALGPSAGITTMSSAMKEADNYQQWLLRVFKPHIGSVLLEIGTGFAQMFHHVQVMGVKEYVSVDVDEEFVAKAISNDVKNTYLCADVSDPNFHLTVSAACFDTVICINVLEHIEHDRVAIKNMMESLEENGKLLLFIPAFPALYSDMDRLAGHHRRYTKATLLAALGEWSNNVVMMEYFNPIGGFGWWVNKFRKYKSLDDDSVNRQIIIFDKYILPISRLLNPLTRNFFGQSLMCVIEK